MPPRRYPRRRRTIRVRRPRARNNPNWTPPLTEWWWRAYDEARRQGDREVAARRFAHQVQNRLMATRIQRAFRRYQFARERRGFFMWRNTRRINGY